MALADIIKNSKQTHKTVLHGTEIQFKELSHDTEQLVRVKGGDYCKDLLKDPDSQTVENYERIFVAMEQLKAGGEQFTDAEFLALSAEYHSELILSIHSELATKVHKESRRMEKLIRERLLAEGKDIVNE